MMLNPIDLRSLGTMLRARRETQEWEIDELARRIGVSVRQAAALEQGDTTLFRSSAAVMAVYLRS